jgi:flagellar motor switch protein FliN/FliY
VADDKTPLNQDDIEALLKSTESGPRTGGAASSEGPRAAGASAAGSQDIESLLKSPRGDARSSSPEKLLSEAEANLAAALNPELGGSPAVAGAAPYSFQPFDEASGSKSPSIGIEGLDDVELDLRIELGRAELLIEEVLELRQGSVVPLDKLAGDPVDILVNGRLIARGEVLVLNDNFCVRVAEILTPDF